MPLREIVILASVYEFGSSIVDGLLQVFADEIFYPVILWSPFREASMYSCGGGTASSMGTSAGHMAV